MGQGNGHGTLVMKNERAVGSRLQEVIEERHALAFHFCDVVESHLGLEPSTWMEGQRCWGTRTRNISVRLCPVQQREPGDSPPAPWPLGPS